MLMRGSELAPGKIYYVEKDRGTGVWFSVRTCYGGPVKNAEFFHFWSDVPLLFLGTVYDRQYFLVGDGIYSASAETPIYRPAT